MPLRATAPRRAGRVAGLFGVLALLGACAGLPAGGPGVAAPGAGLNPFWPAAPAGAVLQGAGGKPLTVVMAPVADARPGQPGRRLGVADAVVFGLRGPDLVLAREATAVVDEALRVHLRAQGLALVPTPQATSLRLETTLQALSLQVSARDTRHVAVQASLRHADGELLWAGLLEDRNDRFAGVSGNDRADLEAYLGAGVANVASQLAAALRQRLAAPTAATTPPLATPASPAPTASPSASPPSAGLPMGYVAVTSVPSRARVYVDDVYHGLTPMTLELPAGVSQLHLKLDGWRIASEKVAVRRGATVELELKLQR